MELFTFDIDGLDETPRVTQFHGEEGISELYRFDIEFALEDDALDFDTVLSKNATLHLLDSQGETVRSINGIIVHIEQGDTRQRLTLYRIELVPKLWLLDRRHDLRIFQEKSAPDIIKEVLTQANIPSDEYSLQLNNSYPPREYCAQYRESDFNFISRLLQQEGMFFFFEHSDNRHKLIIADAASAYPSISGDSTIPFRAGAGMTATEDAITHLHITAQARASSVTLRDYNFKKPALQLESHQQSEGTPIYDVYDYHGEFDVPERGDRLAKVRNSSIQRDKRHVQGNSSCVRLLPGHTFTIAEHPPCDGDHVIARVTHGGTQSQALDELAGGDNHYNNSFHLLPSSVDFCGPAIGHQAARKPKVEGPHTALVVGPSGEEIHTDQYGRIKVLFHWDRAGARDDKSSCWMRVSQSWAGAGWGAWVLPRVGQEVIVDFLGGDPDRPLVTGCVYHATNVPPYKLPDHKTRSTFKTNSTPGGGGYNELRFEDKKDNEEIFLHGQKDYTIEIVNDKKQNIGHDESLDVTNDRTKNIHSNETETVGKNKTISVGENHSESIGKDRTLTIGKNQTLTINENDALTVGKNQTVTIAEKSELSVGKSREATIGENDATTIGKSKSTSISEDMSLEVGKALSVSVGDKAEFSIDKALNVTVGKKTTIKSSDEIALICGDASIVLKKSGEITIKGVKITVKADGNLILKGATIAQN